MKLLRKTRKTPKHAPAPDPQCTAITSRGTRCKQPALPGSDRCVLPSHQAVK